MGEWGKHFYRSVKRISIEGCRRTSRSRRRMEGREYNNWKARGGLWSSLYFAASFFPIIFAPFLHLLFLPYFSLLRYKKNVRREGRRMKNIQKKKNVERRKRSYATMLAHCLPQRNPLNRGRSLRSLHIGKKSELMGVLVAWHRQEHRRIEGQAAGWKKDNRKKEEEEKEEDRPVADRTIDLWWPYIPSKGERKRERMSVSRAVKRRTLAGHVRLTPLPKRPLPTARLRVGILLTERSQTYDPVYFRSYTCCRCVAVAGYR